MTNLLTVKQVAPSPVHAPDIWRTFHTEMDRLFDRFATGFGGVRLPMIGLPAMAGALTPDVDIAEDAFAYMISVELPGLTDKDIAVEIAGTTLTVKGVKRHDTVEKTPAYHLAERAYGEFVRSFVVPDGVNLEKIDATFLNGVLTITLPKLAAVAPKAIIVKPAAC